MKYMMGTIATVVFLALATVGWTVAGRLMTAKDDMSVVFGIVIAGTILGLLASGVSFLVTRGARSVSQTASLDPEPDKKQ